MQCTLIRQLALTFTGHTEKKSHSQHHHGTSLQSHPHRYTLFSMMLNISHMHACTAYPCMSHLEAICFNTIFISWNFEALKAYRCWPTKWSDIHWILSSHKTPLREWVIFHLMGKFSSVIKRIVHGVNFEISLHALRYFQHNQHFTFQYTLGVKCSLHEVKLLLITIMRTVVRQRKASTKT